MPTPDTRSVTVQWSNHDMVGDESLELWVKVNTGAWAKNTTIPVSAGATQSHQFTGLAAGTPHKFQIRATRAGAYRSGYDSGNPDDWPTDSLLAYTTGLPVPVIASVVWERTSAIAEELRFTLTAPPTSTGTDYVVQINLGGTWTDLPTTSDRAGGKAIANITGYGEETNSFRVYFKTASKTGTACAPQDQWGGPPAPTAVAIADHPGHFTKYDVSWTASTYSGAGTLTYEAQVERDDPGPWGAATTSATSPAIDVVGNCPFAPSEVLGRVRAKTTQFAVDDYSDYDTVQAGSGAVVNCP